MNVLFSFVEMFVSSYIQYESYEILLNLTSIMTLVYSSVCAAVHRCKTIGPTSTVIPYNAVTIGFLSTSMTSCFKRLKLNQSGTAPSEIFRRHIYIFLRELIFPDFGGGQKSKPLAIRIWLATAIRLFFIFRTFHKHMFV